MTGRITRAATVALAVLVLTGSPASASGRWSPHPGALNPDALAPARKAAQAQTLPVTRAPFVIDAPTVTVHRPVPTVQVAVTGRVATVTGARWTAGHAVVVRNLSLQSTPGAERAAEPWEGQDNGAAEGGDLCVLGQSGHRLRCDAAAAFADLASAYERDLGAPLRLTDSYRTYEAQVILKETKPGLAATPGRSNHGYGLAIDLAGGAGNPSTTSGTWLREHAEEFGWTLPLWAREGGSKPEPWHWEYTGGEPRPVHGAVGADGTLSVVVPYLRAGVNEIEVSVNDQSLTLLVTAGP